MNLLAVSAETEFARFIGVNGSMWGELYSCCTQQLAGLEDDEEIVGIWVNLPAVTDIGCYLSTTG